MNDMDLYKQIDCIIYELEQLKTTVKELEEKVTKGVMNNDNG